MLRGMMRKEGLTLKSRGVAIEYPIMEKQLRKPRKFEISLMNVLFCILVVFIHVSSAPISELNKLSWQYILVFIPWRLSSFVVQGFIFLSAIKMFLNKGQKLDYKKFYLSRLKSIIMPYVLLVIVYYLYFVYNSYFTFSLKELIRYILLGDLVGHFYFIIIIFQFYALAPLWAAMVKKVKPIPMLAVSLLITLIFNQYLPGIIGFVFKGYEFQYNDRVFTTYLIYWVAGCYIGLHYDKFKTFIKDKLAAFGVLYGACAIMNAGLSWLHNARLIHIAWLEYVHVLYCIAAILFFYILAVRMCEKSWLDLPVIHKIDSSSYLIYLSHCLVIFIVNDFLSRCGITRVGISYGIRIIVTYTVTIGCCILYKRSKEYLSHIRLLKSHQYMHRM